MSSTRIPWWTWFVAASFIACFAVGFLYLTFKLPESTGINLDPRDNRVALVAAGSPGEAAGVKRDDRIVNINGRTVRNVVEIGSAMSNTNFDHAVPFVVLRGSQEVPLQLTLKQTLMQAWSSQEHLGWWVEFIVSLIQLLVGLVVLFKRPRDLTAIAAGIFLCSLGTGNPLFLSPHAGMVWRTLPLVLQWLIFPALILNVGGLPIAPMLLFSLSFPKPLLPRRWAWTMLVVLAAPLLAATIALDYVVLFASQRGFVAYPPWLASVMATLAFVAFLAPMVILAVSYFKLQEVNERRRIRLVVFGLLLFLANLLAAVVFSFSRKTFELAQFFTSPLMFGLAQVPFTI